MRNVAFLLLVLLVVACSDKGTAGGPGPDTTGTDTTLPDTTGPDNPATDDAIDDDAWVDTTFPDWSNLEVFDTCVGPGTPGDLPVGAPCASHNECVTGFCYDEDWKDTPENGGFRFCTIGCSACSKSCAEWDSLTAMGNTCLLFLAAEANDHGLQYRSVCMPTCLTDADCEQASDGELTVCRPAAHYDGSSIGLKKACFPQ